MPSTRITEIRLAIDCASREDRFSRYTLRITGPSAGEEVEVSIDGSPYHACRFEEGYWWHYWSGASCAQHHVVARIKPREAVFLQAPRRPGGRREFKHA